MKRQERVRPACRLSPVAPLETRALMTLAATAPLADLNLAPGASVAPVDLGAHFKDANAAPNFAIVNTTLGTIPVLLTPQTTPQTVTNFVNYANKGAYTNSVVHRSVPGFIWQTGGFQLNAASKVAATPADAPVKNEFGASNVRGTIAMAKLGSDPNSATNQFFFNESNSNAANLDNQNGGFTVFGHVVGAAGLAVLDAVAQVPVPSPSPASSPLDQIPLQNYTTGTPVQPANLVLIKSVTTASELYVTASDAPGVATASVQGRNLTVNSLMPGTAHITVTGYGSDGITATEAFTVNVAGVPGAPTPIPPAAPTPTPTTPAPTAPTPTPTPTQPATPPILPTNPTFVARPSSVLIPAARGDLPASVVAGRPTKIQQTVLLTDPAGPVDQRERVALNLAPMSPSAVTEIEVASATTRVKLKAGRQVKLTLGTNRLSASVPAGSYHVLVSVTDPGGARTTVDTGKTLTVQAPRVK